MTAPFLKEARVRLEKGKAALARTEVPGLPPGYLLAYVQRNRARVLEAIRRKLAQQAAREREAASEEKRKPRHQLGDNVIIVDAHHRRHRGRSGIVAAWNPVTESHTAMWFVVLLPQPRAAARGGPRGRVEIVLCQDSLLKAAPSEEGEAARLDLKGHEHRAGNLRRLLALPVAEPTEYWPVARYPESVLRPEWRVELYKALGEKSPKALRAELARNGREAEARKPVRLDEIEPPPPPVPWRKLRIWAYGGSAHQYEVQGAKLRSLLDAFHAEGDLPPGPWIMVPHLRVGEGNLCTMPDGRRIFTRDAALVDDEIVPLAAVDWTGFVPGASKLLDQAHEIMTTAGWREDDEGDELVRTWTTDKPRRGAAEALVVRLNDLVGLYANTYRGRVVATVPGAT